MACNSQRNAEAGLASTTLDLYVHNGGGIEEDRRDGDAPKLQPPHHRENMAVDGGDDDGPYIDRSVGLGVRNWITKLQDTSIARLKKVRFGDPFSFLWL